ncbi:SusC/RagA family TonB-linked outer membrane protein [Flagellimonas pacifica]|uniref:TonB-linked outer membrane protein, SusC/RagA family n=1 Tax=Flagellimonas pacifica TaxID=1247520 RepID=A0A285M3T4_9FLAO|nr:TonB-dependent receptor [Allomuricauda parva]SNY91433.1 TonB-linked outer membrane protein, SusC/RagA family [Allomuricauda parva]
MTTKNFWSVLVCCLSIFTSVWAQEKKITGSVTDQDGLPLPGVSIMVFGTVNGTQTDFDGNYSISASIGEVLQFSYLGQQTVRRTVSDTNIIDVRMSEDAQALEEVVVVAYGTQKKEEITGSVTTLKTEELADVPTASVVQGLVGKVSGVQIINQSGAPGADPTVRFRGIGSINSSSAPLYVVDGVVFNGNLNSINSQDIEGMTFLKDASANALYGSRGANGVVIITTKKGATDKLSVTIDTKVGFNARAVPEYDIITEPGQYYEAVFDRVRVGLINGGETPSNAAATAAANIVTNPSFPIGYNNYDVSEGEIIDPASGTIKSNANLLYQDSWLDESYRTGIRRENYLSLRYKNDVSNTFLSIGHLNDEGIVINSGFERTTARLSSDFQPLKWLKIGGSVNYAHTLADDPLNRFASGNVSNIAGWARGTAPIYPVFSRDAQGNVIRDSDGNRIFDFGTGDFGAVGVRPSFKSASNPVATSLLDIDDNVSDNFSGRFSASVKFLKDFEFTYNLSADVTNANITQFATPIGGDAARFNGRITTRSNRGVTTAHQQLLNWNKEYGRHSFSVLFGHESNDYNFRLLAGQVTETVIDGLAVLDNGVNIQFLTGYEKDYAVEGYFSRFTYDFDDKYFLNASFRRDGTSVFSPDNKWGNFYGLGVAWSVHKESFLADALWLTNLRLKGSYGQQGNDAILYEDDRTIVGDLDNRNYYAYTDQFDIVNAGGNIPGITFFQLGNEDLVWETSTNINAGLEFGLFDNRIMLNAEYFVREVEDLLFFNPLAQSEGVGTEPENVGDMENKGVEVELGIDIIRSENVNWAFNINGTHYKNEITRLPDEFIDDGRFRLEEGRSRYDYFLREFAGVDPTNGDGLWFTDILDVNGNPTGERETTNDRVSATEYFVGKSAIPEFFGGFSTNFGYKNFSLNIAFAYQIGGYGYDGIYQNLLGTTSAGDNFHNDVFDSWTPENTTASIPRLDITDVNQAGTSDFFLVDASYLNLQNVTLSYSFNNRLLDLLGITGAKVYATGNNLHLWSKARQGYDPRLSITGNALNEFGLARTTSLGLTLNF